jgi:hypothetical protein
MTKLQPHRTRFELKAIVGLLLAAVAAGVFAVASSAENTASSPRSGALHVTKECSQYTGAAGVLDSELVIDGPGKNSARGHVVLDLSTLSGVVTFSGGTGVFTHFHAGPLVVACPAFPDCSWDGPYSFNPHD